MSTTQPQPNEEPSGRRGKADLIETFRDKYADALAEARIQADHTLTDGWRSLYAAERKYDRDARRSLGEQLEMIGQEMAARALGEEYEKELGEIKKTAGILRERREHFALTTLNPIKDCADQCANVINEARAEARLLQDRAPLINNDLVQRMDTAIKGVPRVEWDEEKGMVIIGNSRGKPMAN